jgi:hypothetical protein
MIYKLRRKSLRLREEIGDRRGVCKSLSNLSTLYKDQGHYIEMLEVSRRAADLFRHQCHAVS